MKSESTGESVLPFPNSTRIYIAGSLDPRVRVPMREIALSPTKDFIGRAEANDPVRVYDCSGERSGAGV